jgi:hypothetical protein
MVATFKEGEEVGSKTKQWAISPKDRLPIAIAVLCEQWTNGTDVLDLRDGNHAADRAYHRPHAGDPAPG